LDKIAGADILVVSMAEHGNYSASFKMFLTGVLEFSGFSRKAMLLMASSQGLKQAP
jgi:hypothetical protein